MSPNTELGEAFVVWLAPSAGKECRGQVERVATSERMRFSTAAELIAVITRVEDSSTDGSSIPGTEER